MLSVEHQTENTQIFITVTEDFIESKVMAKKITGDKFEIGNYKFHMIFEQEGAILYEVEMD